MKKIKMLSIVLAVLCFASGCKSGTGTNSSSSASSGGSAMELPNDSGYGGGSHSGGAETLDGFIVKDGKSEYSIVIPQKSDSLENFAANELQALILEATGVELPIVTDTNEVASRSQKILSIGNTKAFQELNVVLSDELGNDGFELFSVDDDVYMCGGSAYGSMYATYEFLWYTLGFKQYGFDTYSLKETTQMPFMSLDIVEVPDFEYRAGGAGYIAADTTVQRRMRWHDAKQAAVKGSDHHNSFKWISKSNQETHPLWFADNDAQLCYTAHGDETELELMLNEALETFKEVYEEAPDMNWLTFTQEDVHDWCTCAACSASKEKYGTDSAVLIAFMNRLSKKMEAYVTSLHADEPNFKYDIDLAFFAYNSTTNAPAVKNKEGVYVPMDESMKMDEHVAVYYAPIYIDYTQSIYGKTNQVYYENSLAWGSLSKKVYLWLYSTNYTMYLVPYDTFNTTQELYQFYASLNTTRIFNQNQHNRNQVGTTGWNNLKVYLQSELSWNVNADVAQLTENFFDACYGPASETMQKCYYSYRVYSAQMLSEGKYVGNFNIYHSALRNDYWSYPILKQWMGYIETALKEIESLKVSNPEKYQNYYKNIVSERVSISYMMLELYESKYSKEYKSWLLESFEADTTLARIGQIRESGAVTSYLANK